MAGKGGGAWKVAYADFVTAMMAFFLVMWITAQSKEVKQAISSYFNDPFAVGVGPAGASSTGPIPGNPGTTRDRRGGPNKRGHGSESAEPDSDAATALRKPGLVAVREGDHAPVGSVVSFAEDSAELDEKAKARLKKLLPLILGKPNKIEIRGHSSGRPLPEGSPFATPWELCYSRCRVTMQFLAAQGIEENRLRLSQAGTFERRSQRLEPEFQASNSRVEVYMLDEFAEKESPETSPGKAAATDSQATADESLTVQHDVPASHSAEAEEHSPETPESAHSTDEH